MVYCLITHRSTSFPGAAAKMLFLSELKKCCLRLSKDEIAKFSLKLNGKKCKNTQIMLLYGIIYILFEKHLREKHISVYIMKPCGEMGQYFEESLRGGKLVLTAK